MILAITSLQHNIFSHSYEYAPRLIGSLGHYKPCPRSDTRQRQELLTLHWEELRQLRNAAAMDVVLEAFDTFLFDRLYANALPIGPSHSTFDPVSTLAASLKGFASNETYGLSPEVPLSRSGWQWEPSNSYFSLQPSEFAYLSRWDRDNIFRQALSLYTITW